MRPLILTIAFLLGLGFGATDSAARCLLYEPAQVTLAGTLTSRAFPGPPNYVSIARGDHPEMVYILTLDEPICVSGDPLSRLNSKSHSHVTEVQLVTRGLDPKRFLNKKIRATGSFFSAHTGHHRTPVVLTVVSLRAAQEGAAPTSDVVDQEAE